MVVTRRKTFTFLGLSILIVSGLKMLYHTVPPRIGPNILPRATLPHHLHDHQQRQRLICLNFRGLLGNRLFEYASVLGLAAKLNRTPVFSECPKLTSALQDPPPVGNLLQQQSCQRARVVNENACCRFHEPFLHDLDPEEDYNVGKFLQSWRYFEGLEAEIKRAVTFKDSVRLQANRTITNLRKRCNKTLVGVHIRGGDYLRPAYIKKGFRTPPPDYFRKALDYMRRRFENVTFLVSVLDKKSFLQSVTSASDVIVLTRQDPAVDLALLSSLDHVITSVGTYSWWVGFLNRGVTVYWKDFVVPGTFIGNSFDPDGSTFIHPGWIPF